MLERINRTMMLEGQQLRSDELEMILQQEVSRLVEHTPRSLWKDRNGDSRYRNGR